MLRSSILRTPIDPRVRDRLTVPINHELVPFHLAADKLKPFCMPALFRNEFGEWTPGSTLRLRYRGRNLVLLTKHQFGKGPTAVQGDRFMLPLIEPDGTCLGAPPMGGARLKMSDSAHSNLEDLMILEYEDTRAGRDLCPYFVDLALDTTLDQIPVASLQAAFALGYPSAFADIDVGNDKDGNLTRYDTISRLVTLFLWPDGPALLDAENRLPMVPDKRFAQMTFDPDGMSGAPVFFVSLDDGLKAHLGFAGIITDARPERYAVYHGALIRRILDDYVEG